MSLVLPPALTSAWDAARRALGPGQAVNRLMQANPVPLIHPDARMIVIFSPKSACTSVVLWFLHQLGVSDKAFRYGGVHGYRSQVYLRSSLYRDALKQDLSDFRVVRVVRDPFDRAASSFRHVQRTGMADAYFSALLGRDDIAAGVSFREFLDLLEHMDLTTCNPHYRIQRHPVEDKLKVTHLINISTEDLFARLNEVEAALGLPVTDFATLSWLHRKDMKRSQFNAKMEVTDAYDMRLTRVQARWSPWPPYSALLTPPARERIARLYAADIAAYGEAPPIGRNRAQRSLGAAEGTSQIAGDIERSADRDERRARRAKRRAGRAERAARRAARAAARAKRGIT